MISALPARSAMGLPIEDGRFAESLAEAVMRADRPGFAARRAASAARGRLRGLGFGSFMETARGQPDEWAALRVDPDGTVELRIGTQSNGQGHETSFPQVVADLLGVAPEVVRLVQADTARVPRGAGHGGARSLHLGGGAIALAAAALLDQARAVAALMLQTPPAALGFAAGRFTATADGRGVDLAGLAAAIARDPALAPPGLAAEAVNACDLRTFPGGTHVAEVEVDPETGEVALCRYLAVDDYGTLVNPMLTAGQVQGGVAQGIGQALSEYIAHDPDSGQLLSASLMDYGLPRASDLPDLDCHFGVAPTAANPLGVKGAGQAGAIAAPQAVVAALLDALAPLGVRDLAMPATPARVWAAIRAARGLG